MSDKIVPIATKLAEKPPVAVQRRPLGGCLHTSTLVDEEHRVVDCAVCGTRLDPIDVLMMLSREWSRYERQYERVRKANVEYANNQRQKWERRRDRHLNANPDHIVPTTGSWQRGECRTCSTLAGTRPFREAGEG